jgi:hypothetical protein
MKDIAVIAICIMCMFLVLFSVCACTALGATLNSLYPPELPLLPMTAQLQLEAGDASDGCSPTDVNPPVYTQDEGRKFLALPPPAVTQDEGGNTLVVPPPAVTQDEGGNTLVLPPPAVIQDKYEYNSGRPHSQSSTFLPVYMDGSDGSNSQ